MKRLTILLAGAAVATAGSALAAINPAAPGLPQNWTMTGTQGYGSTAAVVGALNDNPASAMCVECHSVNPSLHITAPATPSGGYDPTRANDRGSHAVMNTLAVTTRTDPRNTTNSGGGFLGGFGGGPRDAGEYMRAAAWGMSGGSGGVSKYNISNHASGKIVSVLGTGVGTTPTWAQVDMVCESCHNVVMNRGDRMVLADYADNGTDVLCVGCHASGTDKGAEGITYTAFHGNGALRSFNAVLRKRHHVVTGDTLAAIFYDPDTNFHTNDSRMWAPNFTDRLGTGTYGTFNPDTTVAYGATVAFRNRNNVSGVGTRNAALAAGDIAASGSTITCANCHRPHNAMNGAGAFILRTGSGVAFPNPSVGANAAAAGSAGYGLRRQSETGDHSAIGAKIYGEYGPLCQGCHSGYGL